MQSLGGGGPRESVSAAGPRLGMALRGRGEARVASGAVVSRDAPAAGPAESVTLRRVGEGSAGEAGEVHAVGDSDAGGEGEVAGDLGPSARRGGGGATLPSVRIQSGGAGWAGSAISHPRSRLEGRFFRAAGRKGTRTGALLPLDTRGAKAPAQPSSEKAHTHTHRREVSEYL